MSLDSFIGAATLPCGLGSRHPLDERGHRELAHGEAHDEARLLAANA